MSDADPDPDPDLLATDLALPHQPCIPLTLGAGGGACRKPSVWAAVALSPGGLASCAVALFAALGAARHSLIPSS